MVICCDTSFLHSLYFDDAHSTSARKYLAQSSSVLLLTLFNRFEFHNALRLSEFRKILPKEKAELLIATFEKDLATEYLTEATCNLTAVLAEAQRLSVYYVTKEGHRAFDIIHVAAALHLQANIFLTFDQKQKVLAISQGLKTPL
ncbi:MAG: hypothetical protein A3F67_08905 [Verrucomicrobia bacterium RIFCSPHIGHO2_12_FULL_41_10]|nr:MAG: hypothetical protein A3F67_08905 [Verrucomicrobia bacterium RIFCSPHIGHO2_12_FULL_41_10]HLB33407.1 type II toxin-antitoxin system VapC family toxin [Chthoniobacterales bacterium]